MSQITRRRCDRIQEALAELGPAGLRSDEEAQQHLVECDECYAMLEAFEDLDVSFRDLPAVDAPDAAVAATLERIRAEGAMVR